MKEHKWAEVLRAIADGRDVEWQRKSCGDGCWHLAELDWANPISDRNLKWRIKPEPLAWLDEQEFYEVCQQYRHAKDGGMNPINAHAAFQELKIFIRKNVEATK